MPKDIDKSLAKLFIDLKGRKVKIHNWMELADTCADTLNEFHSRNEAAEKLGISVGMFNSVLRLRNLDPRVQDMIRQRELGQDSAQRLNTIRSKEEQYRVAKLLKGTTNKQQREIIARARQSPETDLVDFRGRIVKQPKRERLRVLILPLQEQMYLALEAGSKRTGKPIEKLLPELIDKWLKGEVTGR